MEAKCTYCDFEFKWNDDVVIVNDEVYHKTCVKLYPIGYVAYTEDDDFLGETENDDGQDAYEIFEDLLDD